ncbi:MAG: hypothetical protein ACRD59_14910, partial [Candidatus Acidiferrales bacterium]
MKQNTGIFAALAVVLALFGMSSIPKGSSGGGAASQAQSVAKSSTNSAIAKGAVAYSPCGRIQKKLQPFVANTPQDRWRLPDICYAQPSEVKDPAMTAHGLDFVIATVPN